MFKTRWGLVLFQLVFGQKVREPMTVLRESWLSDKIKVPLSVYVSKFKNKLKLAGEIARENLS